MSLPARIPRRELLRRSGAGLSILGLQPLLHDQLLARDSADRRKPGVHFAPRAKRIIHIFFNGGPSHVDTFDPKPALQKYAGRELPTPNLQTESPTGSSFPSPFKFRRYGASGLPVSELFADMGPMMDDVCVIRSMRADVPNHEPSLMLMNCGDNRLARPSMGSWLTYGLGNENENLPGYVALCPGGYPVKGADNWRSAFLPGAYQGTFINTAGEEERLIRNTRNPEFTSRQQRRQLDLLARINRRHQELRQYDDRLDSRIRSFEQAYRMQTAAVEAFDLSREPDYMQRMYGESPQSRQLLIARRLVERGVRFVQLWHGEGQPWDSHDELPREHRRLSRQCSRGIGALLRDLKSRGLLDETLVIGGGEFGRTPTAQGGKGRDHNHYGFTVWLAGGGIKGGVAHGATDEFGWKAVEKPVHVHDLQATILHLMGLDHTRLTYRYAGRDFRLTDVHGHVVKEILA